MAVPTTNVGLSSIQTEFGGSNPISLSEYYLGGPLVNPATPAPNGPIPSSGQIAIGQFRGAAAVIPVDYLIVAGGGGGGARGAGGGGGAGGYRTSFPGGTSLTLSPGTFPVTVGAGGAGAVPFGPEVQGRGSPGANSVVSTITSTGGGGGGGAFPGATPTAGPGLPGGSGGGGGGLFPGAGIMEELV